MRSGGQGVCNAPGQMVELLLMGLPQFWAISVAVRLPQPLAVK